MTDASDLPAKVEMVVRVGDEEALRRLFAQPLDFGCRPTVIREPDGGFSVPVIATPESVESLRTEGFDLSAIEPRADRRAEVGEGDRFEGGRIAPRGFGRKGADDTGQGGAP
jgi:hypothetical protein